MTNKQGKSSHLRLILTTQYEIDDKRSSIECPHGRQLSFPYPEESTAFFAYIETMSRDDFSKIIGEFTPRWIFDVRVVPRLDTIATSRLSAFHMFRKAKAAYIDVFGLLGINSYQTADSNPAVWGHTITQLLKESDHKGPYLFLFDDEPLFLAADDLLPDVIKPAIGKSARFACIRSSATSECYL